MGMMKNYLLDLLRLCSDQQFGQDAVEWAILTGFVKLTYDREKDLRLIMGEPGKPDTGNYAEITEAYQRVIRRDYDALLESHQPLLEEILPPGVAAYTKAL
jgi:hypothetical protein